MQPSGARGGAWERLPLQALERYLKVVSAGRSAAKREQGSHAHEEAMPGSDGSLAQLSSQ